MQKNKANTFLTPEGLIMMGLAFFFDIIGPAIVYSLVFIPVVGAVFAFILSELFDLLGLLLIGGWMWFRSSTKETQSNIPQRRISQKVKKLNRAEMKTAKWAKRLKWLRPLLIISELVPAIDFLPDWTIVVYLELKYS